MLALADGERRVVATGPDEAVVLPLSTIGLTVEAEGERFVLDGRPSVFARVTDFAYVGRDTTVTLTAEAGGEVAMATARCATKRPPRYGPAEAVPVELRGAGQSTRQVTNFLSPDVWSDAEELMCVEVLTPDGNWSSYPPHKHDDSAECPAQNEEIYYFRIGRAGETDYAQDGFGLHRLYTGDGAIDETVEVRDGDVFLIPARLPRPVRGRARLHHVLPERPGRTHARSLDGVLRRPRPPLGPGHLGGDAGRSPLPDDQRRGSGPCLTVRCSTWTGSCRPP